VSDVRLALCHSIRSGGLCISEAARRFGVCDRGRINFKTYRILCGSGIAGQRVRVEERDREVVVFYCSRQIRCLSHDQLKPDIIL